MREDRRDLKGPFVWRTCYLHCPLPLHSAVSSVGTRWTDWPTVGRTDGRTDGRSDGRTVGRSVGRSATTHPDSPSSDREQSFQRDWDRNVTNIGTFIYQRNSKDYCGRQSLILYHRPRGQTDRHWTGTWVMGYWRPSSIPHSSPWWQVSSKGALWGLPVRCVGLVSWDLSRTDNHASVGIGRSPQEMTLSWSALDWSCDRNSFMFQFITASRYVEGYSVRVRLCIRVCAVCMVCVFGFIWARNGYINGMMKWVCMQFVFFFH